MHILVTNDDGPPSVQTSPYVHCLVKHLQNAGHTVSVCLPHTQRSWIGKAHMIGQTLKPLYYRPSATVHGEESEGATHSRPSVSGDIEEWILVDGTPASCVQIGLNHFFQERGPVDLVVSGPNYGRNTTALFALSSGTLGAALEAAACKRKSIALSFAFFTRNHDPVIIEAACKHSVKVIEALYKQWPTDGRADLYSVNVPLVEGVDTHKTIWTEILQNYWTDGGCFQEIDDEAQDEEDAEREIRERETKEADGSEVATGQSRGHKHKHFKWAPKFADVYKSVEESSPGNDGRVVQEGNTSVTPLKANFAQGRPDGTQKELVLAAPSEEDQSPSLAIRNAQLLPPKTLVEALVSYEDPYVQPLILSAIESVFHEDLVKVITSSGVSSDEYTATSWLSRPDSRALQITPYESIDFEWAATHRQSYLINSYMIRKALIRKHYLASTVEVWVAKNPSSILKTHVKPSESFEVDYAEFLDDALTEAFDLRMSLDKNLEATEPNKREWWILKPSMSDRGQGIRLFSTMEELQEIFDTWEAERPDSEDGDDDDNDGAGEKSEGDGDYIVTSHLRDFVAQPYIHPPLLAEACGNKFHIRTYVLCTGSLNVYVFRHMLALFAAKPYTAPWDSAGDIETFLTNTCLQESPNENTVRRFWNLTLSRSMLEDIFTQICDTTGELLEAAGRSMPFHFQTMPNAFEVFGLDFLVDGDGTAWLLEVNAFPDFKQTGGDLQEIVEGFWKGVMRRAVVPFFGIGKDSVRDADADDDMVLVKEIDLGRR